MRTITLISAVLLITVLLVSGAAADKPQDPLLFQLVGHTTLPPTFDGVEEIVDALGPGAEINDPSTWKHFKIRGLTAEGTVNFLSGPYDGTEGHFFYTENININPGQKKATEQGDMTLTFSNGSIDVQFVGQSDLTIIYPVPQPNGLEVAVIASVDNQPWNITGGTSAFSGVHGNGTRSTCFAAPPAFCVNYYGEIRP